MATDRDTLIFQKANSGGTKDLYADFGIKTTSVPLFVPHDMKEPPSRNWDDEDGEDVYFPEELCHKAYDTDIEVVYKGATGTFYSVQESLFQYFTTGGTELNIYSPYSNTGCKGAFFQGCSDYDYSSDDSGDVALFTIKFRVTKPEQKFSI